MSDQPNPPEDTGQQPDVLQRIWTFVWDNTVAIVKFVWDLFKTFILTVRALLFTIFKTFYVMLPSPAHTSMQDDEYNKQLQQQLTELVNGLELDTYQREAITKNWLGQMSWANSRATRERDANELIRWWQIILGVLIPVLINTAPPVGWGWSEDIFRSFASFAGIFVAILTAVYQFRRPEERWRHYRILAERYQNELWNFVTLAGETYKGYGGKPDGHKQAFVEFHERMTKLKEEDITKFFGEVVASSTSAQQQTQGQTTSGATDLTG